MDSILRGLKTRAKGIERFVKISLFVLPFALLARFVFEKVSNPWNYWQLVQEDALVEWLTAGLYVIAAPVALLVAYRLKNKGLSLHAILLAGLALVMFVVGMEEISWGQRVLGIESPKTFEQWNYQQELNLHNLLRREALQVGFAIIGFYGLVASFVMPVLLKPILGKSARSVSALVSPPWFLKSYFLLMLAAQLVFLASPWLQAEFGPHWGFSYKPDEGLFLISRDREVIEWLLGLGFLFFTCWLFYLERTGFWGVARADQPGAGQA
ncbi:hypothetical protein [Altererythrobacter sp. GH1-8]|uniref:hypothetical protein n=1 Tax=Altererythrobacter sp. GH1-8 TaxID=3349333 RepID=UPI00374CD475